MFQSCPNRGVYRSIDTVFPRKASYNDRVVNIPSSENTKHNSPTNNQGLETSVVF